jgi:ribosome biogenesis GTPase A
MSINWFPGHMVRARREIEDNLKLVDIVVFLLDARAPFSCRIRT